MKAIVLYKYGSTDSLQLKEIDKPVPQNNEVLIKIRGAALTISDVMTLKGKPFLVRFFAGFSKPRNPILGSEFSGEIEALGNHVKRFKVGDSVFGSTGSDAGCYAEFMCMPEDGFLLLKPANMKFEEAADACGGVAAWNFLRHKINIQSGQKILVLGASGSIGIPAIQIAKYFGAEVTVACATENFEMMKSLEVDKLIDDSELDFTNSGETYDIIFDTESQSSFSKCKGLLNKKGTYLKTFPGPAIIFQMLWTSVAGGKKAIFSATGLQPVQKRLGYLAELIRLFESGKMRSIVDKCYPLDQIAEAFRSFEAGNKKGSIVITPS